MSITVELQDMFVYSKAPFLGMMAVVVATGILGVVLYIIKKGKKEVKQEQPVQVPVTPVTTPYGIKEKYINLINGLEMKCRSGEVTNKIAYQELSGIVRHFVYEMTGIEVHHHTLDEIRHLNMPMLFHVIEECYAPEFSKDKDGDIYTTINKARMVVKQWN